MAESSVTEATSRRRAQAVVLCDPQQLPTRRTSQIVVAAICDDDPGWGPALRRAAVDTIVAADESVREALTAVPLDPFTFADDLAEVIEEAKKKPALAVGTSVRLASRAELWGDTHFARDIGDALRRLGWRTETQTHFELLRSGNRHNHVLLYLRGLRPAPKVKTPTALWVISHPHDVVPSELRAPALRLAAGAAAAEKFNARLLLQATDPHRFWPHPVESSVADSLLFVGNSGNGRTRRSVEAALSADLSVRLIGAGWKKTHAEMVVAGSVPNDVLHRYYSSAKAVLNDHWPDMAELGMYSNRLFDTLACGAPVVSDAVEGLDELFNGQLYQYSTQEEFQDVVRAALAESSPSLADERRRIVAASHTFDHRAQAIDQDLRALPGA